MTSKNQELSRQLAISKLNNAHLVAQGSLTMKFGKGKQEKTSRSIDAVSKLNISDELMSKEQGEMTSLMK